MQFNQSIKPEYRNELQEPSFRSDPDNIGFIDSVVRIFDKTLPHVELQFLGEVRHMQDGRDVYGIVRYAVMHRKYGPPKVLKKEIHVGPKEELMALRQMLDVLLKKVEQDDLRYMEIDFDGEEL